MSLMLTLDIFTLTHYVRVSIVDLKKVNTGWVHVLTIIFFALTDDSLLLSKKFDDLSSKLV